MRILAIDPGPTKSTYVVTVGRNHIEEFQELSNPGMLWKLRQFRDHASVVTCVIEQIRGYGLRVGNEVFDTCHWSGRFHQEFGEERTVLMPRRDVALHLCGNASPGDKFIRQAIIDRFGGPAAIKKGGPLYRVAGDTWAALAVALTFGDQQSGGTLCHP